MTTPSCPMWSHTASGGLSEDLVERDCACTRCSANSPNLGADGWAEMAFYQTRSGFVKRANEGRRVQAALAWRSSKTDINTLSASSTAESSSPGPLGSRCR
jgi:hypothetical protein